MISLLVTILAAGAVLATYAVFRRWIVVHRAPGARIQEVVRPYSAEAQFWLSGLMAVACLMVLVVLDPEAFRSGWWGLLLVFVIAAFEVACWASGVYQFSFYEHGLWYGRSWYSYADLRSAEIDRDRVSLFVKGRLISFRTFGTLAPEVRLKLALEGEPT